MASSTTTPAQPSVYFPVMFELADSKAYWRYLALRGPRIYLLATVLASLGLGLMPALAVFLGIPMLLDPSAWLVGLALLLGALSLTAGLLIINSKEMRSVRLVGAAQVWVAEGGFTVVLNGATVSVPWSVITRWGLTRHHLVVVALDEYGYAFPIERFPSMVERHAMTTSLQRHVARPGTGLRRLSTSERVAV